MSGASPTDFLRLTSAKKRIKKTSHRSSVGSPPQKNQRLTRISHKIRRSGFTPRLLRGCFVGSRRKAAPTAYCPFFLISVDLRDLRFPSPKVAPKRSWVRGSFTNSSRQTTLSPSVSILFIHVQFPSPSRRIFDQDHDHDHDDLLRTPSCPSWIQFPFSLLPFSPFPVTP